MRSTMQFESFVSGPAFQGALSQPDYCTLARAMGDWFIAKAESLPSSISDPCSSAWFFRRNALDIYRACRHMELQPTGFAYWSVEIVAHHIREAYPTRRVEVSEAVRTLSWAIL